MDTSEPSGSVLCVRMARETDPYAIPVTSIGRDNRLATGYANKSLRTRLTARAGRGISDDGTSDWSNDTLKVVPVPEPDRATEPYRSSGGLDADLGSDSNSRENQLAPSDLAPSDAGPAETDVELLPQRAPPFAPRAYGPPETPAGRSVISRLPGRFPHIHSSARTAAKDLTDPTTSKASMTLRVGARLRRLLRPGSVVLTPAHVSKSALLFSSLVDLPDAWFVGAGGGRREP